MHYPSLESIMSLSQEPQVDWSAIEELAEDVYTGLQAAQDVLRANDSSGLEGATGGQVHQALSSFHLLRLLLASHLEDYENWGDDWKRYAEQYVPAEHKVRLHIERANLTGD